MQCVRQADDLSDKMTINIELSEADLRGLVLAHLRDTLNSELTENDVVIEAKSKQNYKSEWESAAFRARIVKAS